MNNGLIEVHKAHERISSFIRRTPLLETEIHLKNGTQKLLLKLEYLQIGGSFKSRGALNKVATAPASTTTEDLTLLSKQALDEANHFRMVKEVIEHITGKKVDVEAAIAAEAAKPTAKGADLLAKYEAQKDPLALAAYQFIAEGRAERVWNKMAECIQDQFISTTYAKIAKDEGFHSNIGRRTLELLAADAETQARVEQLAHTMRMDLLDISRMNTTAGAVKLMDAVY